MSSIRNKRGFSLTLLATYIAIIVAILIPSICLVIFYTANTARSNRIRQQAYYNANSGVEYTRFILEHPAVYDPINPAGVSGKSPWPKGISFQCFVNNADMGNVASVVMTVPPAGGYNITSTGTTQGINETINAAHWAAGKIDQWQ